MLLIRTLLCRTVCALAAVCLAGAIAIAGTTGKIAGKITNSQTPEPLIGANIFVVGTTSGAISDLNGNYFIINLPPGTYQLKASSIGYTPVTETNVKVFVDQTTKIDFQLTPQVVEMNEVQVTATRPIVQKDMTSTSATVTSEKLATMPVEDIATVINLQAGVMDGHFRGGRSNEVKYLVDGMPVNDVFSGASAIQPEVNTVEEVQVLSGTFNAEYGEALSGVVNQVTKIGGDHYTAHVTAQAGSYVSWRTDLFPGTDVLSPTARTTDGLRPIPVEQLQADLSGPVVEGSDFLKFFVAGKYYYDDSYIYGDRIFNTHDSSHYAANDPSKWVVVSTGDGELVPMNYNEHYSLQGKLSINAGDGKNLTLQALYEDQTSRSYDHAFRLDPDGDYTNWQKSFLGSVNYNHVISAAAFLEANASLFESDFTQGVFQDPIGANGNIQANSGYADPLLMNQLGANTFLTGGTEMWHFAHHTNTYTGRVALTDQVTPIHQLKMGVETNYHTLRYLDYQVHDDATTGFVPALPLPGAFDYNQYSNHPYQVAAYVQDKIELDYIIVNMGLRWDYFQPDGMILKNPSNIAELDTLSPPYPSQFFTKASAKSQLSPRFGISYPMTDKGAVHISYGHFFQIPSFQYLYKNPNFRISEQGDLPDFVGNTIGNADLQPQRTTMYEIGLQQEIAPSLGVSVTAFYKDIRDLLGLEIYKKLNTLVFGQYINTDYGQVDGFTFSIDQRIVDGFGATLDYTYQIAQGDASDPNSDYLKATAVPPVDINKQLVPLDWDRRHSLNVTLTKGVPGNFNASVIMKLGSGLPYTPSLQNERTGLENSDNRPTFFDVDLNVTKNVIMFERAVAVFLKVYNVFDTPNEINVFGDTGRAGYTLALTQAQTQPQGINTLQQYFTRPDFYSPPREIIVGASLSL